MPADFGETLTSEELNDLVEYLVAETGGGSKKSKGG
jgi:hypothetical protein